ncbi:MAG: flippase-like domain-containing protein [Anaerolineae bacterium]|nr:flippase-like domain-containing protein [Anaerolineae bacterium]
MQKYRNRILIGFAVVFVIYVGLLLFANTGELLDHLRNYPWMLLVPVILLKFCAWFLRFWRWHYYLWVIGAHTRISVFDSAILFVAGFSMAVSPGKIAELLKAVILKVKTGVPVARSAPVVIAERVVDGVAVLIGAVVAFFLAGDNINLGDYRFLIVLSAILLGVGLISVQIRPLAYFFLNLLGKVPVARRFYQPLVDFYESSREILQLRHVIPTSTLGAFAHLTDALGFCIILSGFGLEITWVLYLQAVFITGLTAAVGALSGSPNGAGVTEVSSSGMIMAIIAPQHASITWTIALTVALIDGFFHKWFRVLVGTLVAIIFRNRLFPSALDQALAEVEQERQQHKTITTETLPA